jgi:acetyl-CoA C-acetyltransferase
MASEAPRPVPVLVGVGQVLQRTEDLEKAREPLELMVEAAERAGTDAGSRELLARVEAVRVIRGAWRYGDPGRVLAERLGAAGARTALTPFGGNFVQTVVGRTCLDIQRGALDVALVVGGECGRTRARLKKAGQRPSWSGAPGTPDEQIGDEVPMVHAAELARDIVRPIQIYPMFDNALRFARGESIEDHRQRIAELWAGFSRVAADNPHAWIREPVTPRQLLTPGEGNRPVSFPYPMLMNSNSRVDMGAALLLTSEATARRLGIVREKWVYPHTATDAHDTYFLSERDRLDATPAIRIAGRRVLELAGIGPEDLDYRDVYSCFPSAVQMAAREIGLDPSQPLTVTGGMTFGGGPLNDAVLHAIARMAEVLREDPGARGLVTANGGYLTKHAFGVYSTEPPAAPFRHEDVQAEIDVLPRREAVVDHAGEVTIETYTVMYGPDGPEIGHAACRLPDGRRTWGNVHDRDAAAAMTREEFCGRTATLDGAGGLEVK